MGVYFPTEDYSAMQGPAPDGFHVPIKDEWVALCGILTSTFSMAANPTTMGTYLKMPMAGNRGYFGANVNDVGSNGRYWSSTSHNASNAYYLRFNSSNILPQSNSYRAYGFSVRCFKNSPVVPTSSWTTLYQGTGSAGVFWNSTDGLISVSGDGVTWYTIMDKNLGATTVYNQGDAETDANCGYFYQWGNNYGFAHSGAVTTSSTQVDASGYGPGNYYNSSTFISVGASPYDWSSVQNDNLWGGETGVVLLQRELKDAYIGIPFPTSIVLDKSSINLTTVGDTEQLTATIEPTISDKTINWTSSDTTVATVSSTGLVTCVTPGTCTITATTVNGLTASCSVAEGGLPSTYQEVEYIENSSAGPRIDLGHIPTSNTMGQIKFMNIVQTGYVIYGYYAGDDNSDYRLFNAFNQIFFDIGTPRINGSRLNQNVDYEREIGDFYVKDIPTQTTLISGGTIGSFAGTHNMTLNHSYADSANSCNRWYYVKIYENNVLIRDMIPCYRKNDTEIGMYDVVNGVFYTNSGSGAFTKGPNV